MHNDDKNLSYNKQLFIIVVSSNRKVTYLYWKKFLRLITSSSGFLHPCEHAVRFIVIESFILNKMMFTTEVVYHIL